MKDRKAFVLLALTWLLLAVGLLLGCTPPTEHELYEQCLREERAAPDYVEEIDERGRHIVKLKCARWAWEVVRAR